MNLGQSFRRWLRETRARTAKSRAVAFRKLVARLRAFGRLRRG